MGVYAVCVALPLVNLLLIVAALIFGRRLLWPCRVAVFVNGTAPILVGVSLLDLLSAVNPPPEYRSAVNILLAYTAPILVEGLGLLAILRRRMNTS